MDSPSKFGTSDETDKLNEDIQRMKSVMQSEEDRSAIMSDPEPPDRRDLSSAAFHVENIKSGICLFAVGIVG